jgi:carbon-monoxide dehydrogenase small subunit
MSKRVIKISVNGDSYELRVAPNALLLNVLRDALHLTGTKYVCGIGECGACTVLIDGKPILSCLTLAATLNGAEVTTIEGLVGADGRLDPIQAAFLDHGAYQCGYCTPGLIMASKALLSDNPHPTEADIQAYLRGNLCRCTGYSSIIRAVQGAAASVDSQERS